MDLLGICKYIEDWLTKNEQRANNMAMKIQKFTDEYLEICIDGNVLQLTIPLNFYRSCSADGIISNPNCPLIGILAEGKLEESNSMDLYQYEVMKDLNEKLDRLSSRGYYSFSSVLDSIIDTFEKYKYCSDRDGELDEEDEDGTMAFSTSNSLSVHSQGKLKNGYFEQMIEDANRKCDGARSSRPEVPCNESIKDGILRWCKAYSPSHSNCCIGFEIDLSGILSEYYRRRHGHVFEALGFSFATPLLIEVTFEPLGSSSKVTGESLGRAFRGLSAMHGHIERKFGDGDNPTGQDQEIARAIDASTSNPIHLYGLRTLLPQLAKDFFYQRKRDPDDNEGNIFVSFLVFTGSRLASLLKSCIVCHKELPFTVSKLSSCADELCLFGFEVLGLGAQVLQEVIRMPVELIDLEIFLALAAAHGIRDVFEPFPPFLLEKREIRQRSQLLNNEDNANPQPEHFRRRWTNSSGQSQHENKNMNVLRSIIKSFPPVSEMRLCRDEVNLKEKLAKSWLCTPEGKSVEESSDKYSFGKEVWQLPYNVLRFILCTNRLSLVFLSENDDKVLKVDNSRSQFYQFAVVQDSPEREAVYNESYRKKKQASRFGFHGSPRQNWYSILRNGLRCFSNTKLMSGGNYLGDGIYMANDFRYSANFSLGFSSPCNYGMYGNGFHVLSICEVISSPSTEQGAGDICVVPKEEEESVAVRYLFIFSEHKNLLSATISDGHMLSQGSYSVDLSQHYQSIRQKYASGSWFQ